MLILKAPDDIDKFYCVYEGWLITALHQAGAVPMYKDGPAVYFKKNNKLKKALKKLNIEIDE